LSLEDMTKEFMKANGRATAQMARADAAEAGLLREQEAAAQREADLRAGRCAGVPCGGVL
jgi:hypothetical protein